VPQTSTDAGITAPVGDTGHGLLIGPLTRQQVIRLNFLVDHQLQRLITPQQMEEFTKLDKLDGLAAREFLASAVGGLEQLRQIVDEAEAQIRADPYGKPEHYPIEDEPAKIRNSEMERLIEKAQTEATEQGAPQHNAPDTRADLANVASGAQQLGEFVDALRSQNLPITRTEAEVVINGLRDLTTLGNRAAWQMGLHAVKQGVLSQATLAQMLGVSTATVSRRFHDGLPADEDLSRTDVRSNPIQ
jgi:hypothetical protein